MDKAAANDMPIRVVLMVVTHYHSRTLVEFRWMWTGCRATMTREVQALRPRNLANSQQAFPVFITGRAPTPAASRCWLQYAAPSSRQICRRTAPRFVLVAAKPIEPA